MMSSTGTLQHTPLRTLVPCFLLLLLILLLLHFLLLLLCLLLLPLQSSVLLAAALDPRLHWLLLNPPVAGTVMWVVMVLGSEEEKDFSYVLVLAFFHCIFFPICSPVI